MARTSTVAGMLLIVLVALLAAPALAQGALPPVGSEVEATGYLSPVYPRSSYSHLLNDDTTGATYLARSNDVNLDSYDDGRRVVVHGTLAMREGDPEPVLEVTGVEPAEDPSPGETATLRFELAVEGQPPPEATFFGAVRAEGLRYVPLTDPDGDGLYTGSTALTRFGPGSRPLPPDVEPVSLPVQILQGTGTRDSTDGSDSPQPGEPTSVIEDFGSVRIEDKTLSASVSFGEDREGTTTPDSGDSDHEESPGNPLLGTGGGVALATLGVGALLITGGLLARRATR